jgi:Tol biopolymer transport system component
LLRGCEYGASLSSDGRLLAVAASPTSRQVTGIPRGNEESGVFVVDLKTEEVVGEFEGGHDLGRIAWSPGNQALAFSAVRDGTGGTWLLDIATGKTIRIDHGQSESLAWAPDGCSLARVLRSSPADSTTLVQLLDTRSLSTCAA